MIERGLRLPSEEIIVVLPCITSLRDPLETGWREDRCLLSETAPILQMFFPR